MIRKRSIAGITGLLIMIIAFAACSGNNAESAAASSLMAEAIVRPDKDREGYAITLPEEINTIISIGPSNTEILVGLGFGGRIIATDDFSGNVEGIQPGISSLNMMFLDAEFIIGLQPDIIFITGMSRVGGGNPLSLISDTGISIVYMPTSNSITDIMEDIRFIAAVMGVQANGEDIITSMEAEINSIRQIAETITERRTVYFEISPAPFMYSFGTGTYMHEMIELAGAENIFADREGWISVTDEALLLANPDIILTSVNFPDNPIAEIMGRVGWGVIAAVQNGRVYSIDADYSNRPSQNIIRALREIAQAVYPDLFP